MNCTLWQERVEYEKRERKRTALAHWIAFLTMVLGLLLVIWLIVSLYIVAQLRTGDLNLDGKVNRQDLMLMATHYQE